MQIQTPWVFFLDADEVVPDELWAEVAAVVQQPHACAAYLIRKGFHFETRVDLVDITPTILALLGLPIASDMTGRVATEIIEPAFLEKYPLLHIHSYEEYVKRESATGGTGGEGMEESLKARLEALGYVGQHEDWNEAKSDPTSKPTTAPGKKDRSSPQE